jgi:cyclopropane-fatty-acyl-phospholipid synthase
MSHESVEPGRAIIYNLPKRCSDTLRSVQFSRFFEQYRGQPFAVRTADGWFWSSSTARPAKFVATFRTREGLDAVVGDANEVTLGRIFLDGGLDIQGNIFVLLSVAEYTLRHSEGLSSNLVQTIGRISLDAARRLMHGHKSGGAENWQCSPCPLELPAEFFEPWLGSFLAHCCAFFRSAEEDLDAAQLHAMENVCDRLALEAGDHLLGVGCGWGSLLLYAAEHYGANVRGIASSETQVETAEDRIRRSGLQWKCSVQRRDLRTSPYRAGSFDKILHVGVFEQAPFTDLGKYLVCMRDMLVPEGLLLLDRMTCSHGFGTVARPMHPALPVESLSKELELAEAAGLELLNVETLRKEYDRTLSVWIERLLTNWMRDIDGRFDRESRAWLFYLVEVAAGLRAEAIQVHRLLFRRSLRKASFD